METIKDHLATRLLATHLLQMAVVAADLLLVLMGMRLQVATPTDLGTGMRTLELGAKAGLLCRLLLDLGIGFLGMVILVLVVGLGAAGAGLVGGPPGTIGIGIIRLLDGDLIGMEDRRWMLVGLGALSILAMVGGSDRDHFSLISPPLHHAKMTMTRGKLERFVFCFSGALVGLWLLVHPNSIPHVASLFKPLLSSLSHLSSQPTLTLKYHR